MSNDEPAMVRCGNCNELFDFNDRLQVIRHDHKFCLSSPPKFDASTRAKMSESAKAGWEKRREGVRDE